MFISEEYMQILLERMPTEDEWKSHEPELKKHGLDRKAAEGMLKQYHSMGSLGKAAANAAIKAKVGKETHSKLAAFLR